MIRIYIFTYERDAQEAVACARCARTALPGALVTVVDDVAAPVPKSVKNALLAYGARYRQSSFPRRGNLNGHECVRGVISTLACDAANDDIVVKIDSDTALLSGKWIEEMTRDGLDWHGCRWHRREFCGLCYAIRGRAAKQAVKLLEEADIAADAPEDLTIGRAVLAVSGKQRGRYSTFWTPQNREGRWSCWNWDSSTTNPESYARLYDVVSVGNPRPPYVPKSARWEVMHALCDAAIMREEGGL